MPDSPKRLGAVVTTSVSITGAGTVLYTVPALASAIVSTLWICNRGITQVNYKVAHVDAGTLAQIAVEDYFIDNYIVAKDTVAITSGISMSTGDSLIVWSDGVGVNFIAHGLEITAG